MDTPGHADFFEERIIKTVDTVILLVTFGGPSRRHDGFAEITGAGPGPHFAYQ